MFKRKKSMLYIKENLQMTQEMNRKLSKKFQKVYFATDIFLIERIAQSADLNLIVLDTGFIDTELIALLEKIQMQNDDIRLLFQHEHNDIEGLLQGVQKNILENFFALLFLGLRFIWK